MDLVHQLRREKGWTQEHLAKAADVDRSTIQRIEAGQVRPDKETLMGLASALGVDAGRLREGAGLAARVFHVARAVNERAPTPSELRPLPAWMRRAFSDYAATRAECEAIVKAMDEATKRCEADGAARSGVHSEFMRLAAELRARPDDVAVLGAYLEVNERLRSWPRGSGGDEAFELLGRLQVATRSHNEAFLALNRVLMQFL